MGTLQLSTGAVMIVLVSALYDGTPLSMVGCIALCSWVALALSRLALKPRPVYP
jgi:MFS transporter, DHA1 family, multidrug resistance protein